MESTTTGAHAGRIHGEGLDVARIRARFPALRALHAGRPVAYLDGPGGSQTPDTVIEAMAGYLRRSNANLGGAFPTSRASDAVVEQARTAAAELSGATPEEIAFGPNMTTLNYLLAHAVARTLRPGDEVVVTDLDHDANVSPWLQVAADHGLIVRHAPIRVPDGTLDLDRLEGLLSDRTRIVAMCLASNALGTVPDSRRVADAAHRVGALLWADAVHAAPHRRPDRTACGADVLLWSPYKVFGPHLGVAVIRRGLAESLPADRVRPASQWPPGHRFETGTQSHEALAGLTATVDYLASLGEGRARPERLASAYERIRAHEDRLAARALARLAAVPGLTLYGIGDPARLDERTPTFAFTLARRTPREVAEALAAAGIYVWDGDYYAYAPMRALGLADRGGAVRAGFLHYNALEEADRLGDELEAIAI